MADALAGGERERLCGLAHRASGGLALYGFDWGAWQSRQIEVQALEGGAERLTQRIGELREHLMSVRIV